MFPLQKPTLLPKLYTREFPLILCEIWGRTYQNFLGRETRTFPYYVFIINDFLVAAYRNPALVAELNTLLASNVKENPNFFTEFNARSLRQYDELKDLWTQAPLSKEALRGFIEKMVAFWPAIYASMYVPEYAFSPSVKDLMLALRKRIADAADEATHAIVASLKALYPGLGPFVSYLKTGELSGTPPPKEELEARSKQPLILLGSVFISDGELQSLKTRHHFDLETVAVRDDLQELTGQIACQGIAQGRVRLVVKREQVSMLQEGEVLVSTMTVPDYVPAMEKAAAFVTDEGGITCHAAIVAREMKKPCIIGTKVATHVLKNGDLVEVDARHGIVRILA